MKAGTETENRPEKWNMKPLVVINFSLLESFSPNVWYTYFYLGGNLNENSD